MAAFFLFLPSPYDITGFIKIHFSPASFVTMVINGQGSNKVRANKTPSTLGVDLIYRCTMNKTGVQGLGAGISILYSSNGKNCTCCLAV